MDATKGREQAYVSSFGGIFLFRGHTVSSTTTNLNKRKRKESLAFIYFSSRLHLLPDKTFICTTMFSFHVCISDVKKCKILRKAWKRKLSFHFSWCLKEVYISHCTVLVGALYTDLRIWWMIGCNKLAILHVNTFVYLSSSPLLLSQIIILKSFPVMKTNWKVTSQTYFSKLMRAVHSLKVLV